MSVYWNGSIQMFQNINSIVRIEFQTCELFQPIDLVYLYYPIATKLLHIIQKMLPTFIIIRDNVIYTTSTI